MNHPAIATLPSNVASSARAKGSVTRRPIQRVRVVGGEVTSGVGAYAFGAVMGRRRAARAA